MKSHIALLRGINVGGNNKVPMADLKLLFTECGYTEVTTYINSGNILFKTERVDSISLQKAIEKRFDFSVPTMVLDKSTFTEIAAKIPHIWQNDKTQKTDVLFLWPEFDSKEILKETPFVSGVDEVMYVPGGLIWHIDRKNQNKSYMQKGFIGSKLYKKMTARNVNTVRKLVQLLDA